MRAWMLHTVPLTRLNPLMDSEPEAGPLDPLDRLMHRSDRDMQSRSVDHQWQGLFPGRSDRDMQSRSVDHQWQGLFPGARSSHVHQMM